MSVHTPAHKNPEHPAAQVQALDRFLHPTLGPLVAREVPKNSCTDLRTGDECAAFAMPGISGCFGGPSPCPHRDGGPYCNPEGRPDGKPIIWIRDPAYVK